MTRYPAPWGDLLNHRAEAEWLSTRILQERYMLLNELAGREERRGVQFMLPGDIPATLSLGPWNGKGRRFWWALWGRGLPRGVGHFNISRDGSLWVLPESYSRTRSRRRREALASLCS